MKEELTETVADIVAEMRAAEGVPVPVAPMRAIWLSDFKAWADRLEAAHKREVVERVTMAATEATNLANEKWERDLKPIVRMLDSYTPTECDNKEPSPERFRAVLEYWEERGIKPPTDEKGKDSLRYEAEEIMDECGDCVCETCPTVMLRHLVRGDCNER